ncbi:MAG: divalent-cation tolerance protein CutA [Anaerolineales bacterium]|nr:divalent-cation tolerance protein CutA [Anaerolineales bacterium]
MNKFDSVCLVLVTAPDSDTAVLIANTLLEKKLAACVNIYPGLRSIYRWEGKIQDESEVLMMIKTRVELIDTSLIPLIQELHPYQVPEIISLPISGGSEPYLSWIFSETTGMNDHLEKE